MKSKDTSKEALNEICDECNRTGDCDKKYGACPNFMKVWNDLGELEKYKKIEEELGSIEVLYKAIKNGIYVYDNLKRLRKIEPDYLNISLGSCLGSCFAVLQELYFEDLDCVMDTTGARFGSDEYKKTWWLKESKEE